MEELIRPLSSDGRLEAGKLSGSSPGGTSVLPVPGGGGEGGMLEKKRSAAGVLGGGAREKNSRAEADDDGSRAGDGVVEELDSTEEHAGKMWAGQPNILVAVRVRPLLKHDRVQKGIVKVLDRKVVVIMDPNKVNEEKDVLRAKRSREKHYAFDYAFEEADGQEIVYRRTTKFLIQGVLDGFNATVFAYGNTGAGKTYTMIGMEHAPGIMVLTLQDLFRLSKAYSVRHGLAYKVTVSFLEVYNESIRDLLSDVEEFLDLREDPIKGPVVAGITEVQAQSAEEIMDLLQRGNRNRTQHPTAANEVSSRSHAVLQVVVESRDRVPGSVENYKIGKLSLVDLAGSERAAVTQNRGARLTEGANINRSLLALGNCINALGEKGNKGHFVPYRDSKLTRLLKDSLGGNCRTVMIANISGAISSFEETLNTLKYANRAKNIKTNIRRNVLSVNHHISEYVALISGLRGEIAKLKQQLADQCTTSHKPPPILQQIQQVQERQEKEQQRRQQMLQHGGHDEDLTQQQLENMEEVRKLIVENFRERMQLRRSLIELEDQNVQNSIEVGKRQLVIFEWQEAQQGGGGGKEGGGRCSSLSAMGGLLEDREERERKMRGVTAEMLHDASEDVKVAYSECEQLSKAIEKNNVIKRSIGKRLKSNERQAEKLREDLTTRVNGEERRELMELQYRIGRLELENMELEQSRIVHESMMKGKDLTIQKLLLQLAVRDKVIQHQHKVLQEHKLDSKVSYSSLQVVEQAVSSTTNSEAAGHAKAPPPPVLGSSGSSNSLGGGPMMTERSCPPALSSQQQQQQACTTTTINAVTLLEVVAEPPPPSDKEDLLPGAGGGARPVGHVRGGGPRQSRMTVPQPQAASSGSQDGHAAGGGQVVVASRPAFSPPHRVRAPSNLVTSSSGGSGSYHYKNSAKEQTALNKQLERIQSIYTDDSWWHGGHQGGDRHNRRRARGARRETSASLGGAEDFISKNKRRVRRNSLEGGLRQAAGGGAGGGAGSNNASGGGGGGGGGGGHPLKWKGTGSKRLAQVAPLPCISDPPSHHQLPAASPIPPPSPVPSDDGDVATQASAPLLRKSSVASNLSDMSADSVHSASSASLVDLEGLPSKPPEQPSMRTALGSLKSRIHVTNSSERGLAGRPDHRRSRMLHNHLPHQQQPSKQAGGSDGLSDSTNLGAAAPQAPSASAKTLIKSSALDESGNHDNNTGQEATDASAVAAEPILTARSNSSGSS